MKIIAIHIAGFDKPRYVSHYEQSNGEPIVLITTNRKEAAKFTNDSVIDIQCNIRDGIAKLIARGVGAMLQILRETTAINIENEIPNEPIVMKLTGIRRIASPMQTVGFSERVDSIYKNATFENNYKMMIVESPNQALKEWWKEYERVLKVMPPAYYAGLHLPDQFEFTYQICEVKNGAFWPSSGVTRAANMGDIIFKQEVVE